MVARVNPGEGSATAPDPDTRREARWLACILIAALAVRLLVLIGYPNIHYADEIYQNLEQAHRFVFGYGVVPWEYRLGTRSWILPGVLSVPLWLGGQLGATPEVSTLLAGGLLASSSLLVVVGAFALGRRISLTHAITAGFAATIWFELIYHAGRTLTEVVATTPLVLALVIASKPSPRRADLLWTGALLGLCLVLRFHLAPGLAAAALMLMWRHGWRVVVPLCLGGLVPLLAAGAIDAWTWGEPFASLTRNLGVNIVEGRAATFGEEPFYEYVLSIGAHWLVATPVLLLLIGLGARRFPIWLATAVAVLVTHSLIGHKEYRFIFPAVACLVILAGVGSGDVVDWIRRRARDRRWVRLALPACLAAWVLMSLALSLGPFQRDAWTANGGALRAFHWLNRQPDLCGVALNGLEWAETGGYAHLHRDVPLYPGRGQQPVGSLTEAFNYQVHRTSASDAPSVGYQREMCFADPRGEVCVFRREGGCEPMPGHDINNVLVQTGQ